MPASNSTADIEFEAYIKQRFGELWASPELLEATKAAFYGRDDAGELLQKLGSSFENLVMLTILEAQALKGFPEVGALFARASAHAAYVASSLTGAFDIPPRELAETSQELIAQHRTELLRIGSAFQAANRRIAELEVERKRREEAFARLSSHIARVREEAEKLAKSLASDPDAPMEGANEKRYPYPPFEVFIESFFVGNFGGHPHCARLRQYAHDCFYPDNNSGNEVDDLQYGDLNKILGALGRFRRGLTNPDLNA